MFDGSVRKIIFQSTHVHRHQRHGIITENIDDFDRHGVSTRLGVGVGGGGEFQIAVTAGAEALPLVLENVGSGPAFFDFDELARRSIHKAWNFSLHKEAANRQIDRADDDQASASFSVEEGIGERGHPADNICTVIGQDARWSDRDGRAPHKTSPPSGSAR